MKSNNKNKWKQNRFLQWQSFTRIHFKKNSCHCRPTFHLIAFNCSKTSKLKNWFKLYSPIQLILACFHLFHNIVKRVIVCFCVASCYSKTKWQIFTNTIRSQVNAIVVPWNTFRENCLFVKLCLNYWILSLNLWYCSTMPAANFFSSFNSKSFSKA